MSAGNPLDARHPIRGLETGDTVAWTMVTGETLTHRGDDFLAMARETMLKANAVDLLVVAIPPERRTAVTESMQRALGG